MAGLFVIMTIGLVLCSYYVLAKTPATATMITNHPMIAVWVMIGAVFLLTLAGSILVIDPCRATTRAHTVTDNLGRFYSTENKDSGEWCLWVRGNF
jgi:hypothetical protein